MKTLYSVQDPDTVDDTRQALGMPDTRAQTEATIGSYPHCYFKAK